MLARSNAGVGLEERDTALLGESDAVDVDKVARLEYKIRRRYLRNAKNRENLDNHKMSRKNHHGSSKTNLATIRMAVSTPTTFSMFSAANDGST